MKASFLPKIKKTQKIESHWNHTKLATSFLHFSSLYLLQQHTVTKRQKIQWNLHSKIHCEKVPKNHITTLESSHIGSDIKHVIFARKHHKTFLDTVEHSNDVAKYWFESTFSKFIVTRMNTGLFLVAGVKVVSNAKLLMCHVVELKL